MSHRSPSKTLVLLLPLLALGCGDAGARAHRAEPIAQPAAAETPAPPDAPCASANAPRAPRGGVPDAPASSPLGAADAGAAADASPPATAPYAVLAGQFELGSDIVFAEVARWLEGRCFAPGAPDGVPTVLIGYTEDRVDDTNNGPNFPPTSVRAQKIVFVVEAPFHEYPDSFYETYTKELDDYVHKWFFTFEPEGKAPLKDENGSLVGGMQNVGAPSSIGAGIWDANILLRKNTRGQIVARLDNVAYGQPWSMCYFYATLLDRATNVEVSVGR
jgi:hypothetical protein